MYKPNYTVSKMIEPEAHSVNFWNQHEQPLPKLDYEDYPSEIPRKQNNFQHETASPNMTQQQSFARQGFQNTESNYVKSMNLDKSFQKLPSHIRHNNQQFQESAPSPFMLYYYDESAPSTFLLHNNFNKDMPLPPHQQRMKRDMACCGGTAADFRVNGIMYSEKLNTKLHKKIQKTQSKQFYHDTLNHDDTDSELTESDTDSDISYHRYTGHFASKNALQFVNESKQFYPYAGEPRRPYKMASQPIIAQQRDIAPDNKFDYKPQDPLHYASSACSQSSYNNF